MTNHETSPGGGFIRFKMADRDGEVEVETSVNMFSKTMEYKQWPFDRLFPTAWWIIDPDFALFFTRNRIRISHFCLFTASWVQDPNVEI